MPRNLEIIAQYTEFLNAADPTGANANGIYNTSMGSNIRGGITYTSGAASGSKYTIRTSMGDKPVNFVSWYDAACFTNWLHNGQGAGSTETGAYTLIGNTGLMTKNVGATVWLHSYFVANLRISHGVEVRPGNEHAAAKGLPGLWQTLDKLPRDQWPTLSRGDSGFGSENVMLEHEERGLPYLFKLRHTPKVKDLVARMMRQGALWQDCGDGWQALEATIRLSGWTRERRVVLVRESPASAPVARIGKPRRGKDRQKFLPKAQGSGWDAQATPWSGKISVLVTSLDPIAFPTTAIPKHYRDRGDAENSFDELKNQWGWGGYTSRKLAPSRLMANLIALFYNWWNLYLRFYDEMHHREAIRSRPMLMAGVGRQVQSGGKRTVKVSILREKGDLIAQAVTQISKELHQIRAITER